MNKTITILVTIALYVGSLTSLSYGTGVRTPDEQARELANLDVASKTIGTIRSWIRNEPEAAIHAFRHQEAMLKYAQHKLEQYEGAPVAVNDASGLRRFSLRIQDRKKSLKASITHWQDVVPTYKETASQQLATELKRQRDAVARYKKSRSPRPSSFAYIPKTVWETKDKIDVLTASGVDTTALVKEQAEVQALVLELVASMDVNAIAKANRAPRDAYRRDDREAIEDFVRTRWSKQHAKLKIDRIVIPKQSWSNTYAARFNNAGNIEPLETDRMTVYVVVAKTAEVSTLHPFRLQRENYLIHGKLLGKLEPQSLRQIPTNEFPIDVLTKNLTSR